METKNGNNEGKMTLDGLAEIIQKEFGSVRGEIGGVKREVSELKSDVSELKSDVSELKSDVSELKTRVIRLDNKIDDLRDELKEEIREKFDAVLSSEDRTMKRIEDSEEEKIMEKGAHRRYEDKLDDHEERIGTVEKRLDIARAAG